MSARATTPDHRRATRTLTRGPRSRVDHPPDRPLALHRNRQVLDPLLGRDRHRRFRRYAQLAPSNRVEDLLTEIDRDPTGIFCG
jgi:Protein of unknown function (DUF3024)